MKNLNQKTIYLLFILFFAGLTIHAQQLTINGHSFYLNEKPFSMLGVRVASASQNDEFTKDLVANLDDYKSVGINTISVFLQGSSGGYSEVFLNQGKEIEKDDWKRLTKIIKACAKRDMVVIVGIFYQRTVKNPGISMLKTEQEIRNAVRTVAQKLKPFKNVIINIANEQNSGHYKDFTAFDFNDPENIISLCEEVKKVDPNRIVGGGGYHDESNVVIGKSASVDVLLFDTFSGDIEKNQHSGWHYEYFREQGVPDKPIVNVELFGGWTRQFMPQGVFSDKGKEIYFQEIEAARRRPGLYIHFHANPWFQAAAQDLPNRFDLGGDCSPDKPGVRWFFERFNRLDNPVTTEWLQKNMSKKSPKLILTPKIEKELKKKLKSDPVIQSYFQYLKNESKLILEKPLLERELQGFRLLAISREMVERMGILCMVYRIEKDPEILERINQEILAVCAFQDWNPQHFLDVGEMSFAVALAIDWVGQWLPDKTVELAKTSLIEKGIMESFNEENARMFWINSTNNWNAVCHGGMIAAALATADVNPELSAKTISRALDKLPGSLSEYAPDGVYPEGPTYWGYGTTYTVLAANMLQTSLGSDFGITKSPGFMKSPDFVLQTTAPSGEFFNFADCGDSSPGRNAVLLSWFAATTGDELYFNTEFFKNPENPGRIGGPGLVWLSLFEKKKSGVLESEWFGDGKNPVAVFRDPENDFYLAMKGGKANLSHGNMDAGTFVFELNGIRWVVDPGNQSYYPLNRIGFNLAGHCQECPRWTLLTKKNQGHSTITVNNERFDVNATAKIIDFKAGSKPEVTIDLTPLYFNHIKSVIRKFSKENNQSILIEDRIQTNENTKEITWGLMTEAEVQPDKNGAILEQDGKKLKLTVLEPESVSVSVVSLDPPPMEIDKTIENFKRIEISVPACIFEKEGTIKVRLSSN